MKPCLFFCLLLILACHSAPPNSRISTQKTREALKYYFNRGKEIKIATRVIRDEQTAIKVAEAILFKIYGEKQIKEERPYTIGFADGYWLILGSLHEEEGGVFEIIIDSKNGGVVYLSHGK